MLAEREDRLDEAVAAFLEARETGEPFDRAAWLRAYPDLREELDRFLADHDSFDQCMAPLRAAATDTPAPSRPLLDSRLLAGRTVGEFELLEELGRGGMGIVFKARQAPLGRVVALKTIRAGALATADDLRRFQREAQLVARLDHPNIVPVYQTGVADGLHFFSMKLVKGGSLARRRDDFRDPRSAASLVAAVARAVDFAHRHGVLHRDLKPGNILLDAEGTPHVTDFGLARTVDAADTTSGALGTPAYMAPEQATGEAVSTAADVYSLGAILYELLTGRVPFRGETAFGTLLEALDHEPERPRRLAPRLDHDLETVCLKCLDKDASRRYDSAAALADDLERWLRREPVRARPVGPLGRLARWARRHPLPAGLSAALALAVLAGVPLVVWQWRRAERHLVEARLQRQRAEDGWRDAREVLDEFCNRLSDARLSRLPGTGPMRQELLEAGLRHYERFLERRGDDPLARRDVADAHFRLGAIRAALGSKAAARDEYQKAIDLYAGPPTEHTRQMTAKARNNLGLLLWDEGQIDAAASCLRQAEELWAAVLVERPDSLEALNGRSKALTNLGLLRQEHGDPAGAAALAEAHALQQRLAAARPSDTEAQADLGRSFHTLANGLAAVGKHTEELDQLRQAKIHLDAAARLAPWDGNIQLSLAEVQRARGGALWALNRRDEAEAEYRQCRSKLDALVQANPEVGPYRAALATLLTNFGAVYIGRKQPAEARAALDQAVAIQTKLLAETPSSRRLLLAQGTTQHNLGNVHREAGRLADAEACYRLAAEVFRRVLAAEPADHGTVYFLGGTLNNLASVRQQLDDPDEALATFAEAAERLRAAFGAMRDNPRYREQLAATLGNLARAERRAGHANVADALQRERDQLRNR